MRTFVGIALLTLIPAVGMAADNQHPDWAFPVRDQSIPVPPRPADSGQPLTVPGSKVSFTQSQLTDPTKVFADWFPEDHPQAPEVVALGKPMVRPCATCHTPAGLGHPESANLTGLTVDYQLRQLAAFKDGSRKGGPMNNFAKAISEEDARAAVTYFAALKPKPWDKIVETDTVPKTYVGQGNMRFVVENGGQEPLGTRIIEVPENPELTEGLRDPHSGFIAYVPRGSVKKGEALATTGGRGETTRCAICHGEGLKGLGNVPRIAGSSPVFIAREIYMIKNGERADKDAELMKPVVAKLTDTDIVDLAAYVASLH
jgi:cytochrome c553